MIRLMLFAILSLTNYSLIAQFNEGVRLYDQQKFEEAIQSWNKNVQASGGSVSLYFNIANAHYKLQQYPLAILYYNKALKWDPSCTACKNNLSLAQKAAGVETFQLPEFAMSAWYYKLLISMQAIYWMISSMVLISIVIFLKFFIKDKSPRQLKPICYSMWLIAIICFAMAIHRDQLMHQENEVVLTNSSGLYLSPDDQSEIKQELIPGQILEIEDQLKDWYKVQTKEFDLGWVEKKNVSVIDL